MTAFLTGLFLFFGVHSLRILQPDIRDGVISRFGGRGAWLLPYTLIAGIGLATMIYGYGQIRYASPILYLPAAALRHFALLLLAPVFILLFATYFPGKIKSVVRHPMLIAIMLWASAHLMTNGSWADVMLFGAFLLWAMADLVSVIRRRSEPTYVLKAGRFNDIIAITAGIAMYLFFLAAAHRWLIGIAPL